jgi:hypothetical protein
MRRLLGRVGVRVAVAAGLLLLVLGVVAVARATGGSERSPLPAAPTHRSTPTVDPSFGDDAEVAAAPSAYADSQQVIGAAKTFTAAWLKRDASPEAWHAAIVPLSTETLAASLKGVDPLSVPASRTTAEPSIARRTELFAEVTTSVDSGVLELTLLKVESRWLVDGVDWERA